MDSETMQGLHVPTQALQQPVSIRVIDGGLITTRTEPLLLQVRALHYKTILFMITETKSQPMILGFPWLQHDPPISWQESEILQCPMPCI